MRVEARFANWSGDPRASHLLEWARRLEQAQGHGASYVDMALGVENAVLRHRERAVIALLRFLGFPHRQQKNSPDPMHFGLGPALLGGCDEVRCLGEPAGLAPTELRKLFVPDVAV